MGSLSKNCALVIKDGDVGSTSQRPSCLRTWPPLGNLFNDVFGLNESDDGHRHVALVADEGVTP